MTETIKTRASKAIRDAGCSARDWSNKDEVLFAIYTDHGERYVGAIVFASDTAKPLSWFKRDRPIAEAIAKNYQGA